MIETFDASGFAFASAYTSPVSPGRLVRAAAILTALTFAVSSAGAAEVPAEGI